MVLRDGIEETAAWESHRPKLVYPMAQAPGTGEAVDIAPGVKWLRMPLGGALAWINLNRRFGKARVASSTPASAGRRRAMPGARP